MLRSAATLVLDRLEVRQRAEVPLWHWFSGTKREFDRAVAMGCWCSVGPRMLRSRKRRELAPIMALDRPLIDPDRPGTWL